MAVQATGRCEAHGAWRKRARQVEVGARQRGCPCKRDPGKLIEARARGGNRWWLHRGPAQPGAVYRAEGAGPWWEAWVGREAAAVCVAAAARLVCARWWWGCRERQQEWGGARVTERALGGRRDWGGQRAAAAHCTAQYRACLKTNAGPDCEADLDRRLGIAPCNDTRTLRCVSCAVHRQARRSRQVEGGEGVAGGASPHRTQAQLLVGAAERGVGCGVQASQ